MFRYLPVLVIALSLGGCHFTSHSHYHDHADHQDYTIDFVVTSTGGGTPVTWCTCSDELFLELNVTNLGPHTERYDPDPDGHTHRFIVYDAWGYLVWDSDEIAHDHTSGGINLPVGATLYMNETWDLTDSFGVPVDPGFYTIEAYFDGEMYYGGQLPNPDPITIEVVASGTI